MKSLVIAEKPSVGRDIARVLGCKKQAQNALEGENYIVTWALGHLVTLADPEDYDSSYKEWKLDVLPMMPDHMKLVVIRQSARQFQTVKNLIFRKDVKDIIIATDAGREGELVARWILEKAGAKKPLKRLWISSVTDKAIREGFSHLKDGRDYQHLYDAASARAQADWLVGINATRALTCKYNAQLSCGRVQTPTLAIIARREEEIRQFKPKEYYGLTLQAGHLRFTWQEPKSKSTRTFSRERIDDAAKKLQGKTLTVTTVEKTKKRKQAPGLYDLTELQRDANKRFGFSAKETLNIMQRLYEHHKVLTYPRTDSRYIGSDVADTLKDRLRACGVGPYKKLAGALIMKPLKTNASFVNDKKVSDHHAIIPTKTMVGSDITGLTSGEKAVLQLIAARLLCAVAEDHSYAEITVKLSSGAEEFTRKGKTVLVPGWKAIWQHFYPEKKKDEDASGSVPAEGTLVHVDTAEVKEGKTSPPKHFTEDTLLSAMETAGADETPDEAERKGLGTPATRAATIEKLVQRGFIERKGDKKTRQLIATEKGNSLITVMPEQIQSASMTAEWEQKLLQVEHGEQDAVDFMSGIEGMIANLVTTYEKVKGADALMSRNKVIGTCPHCGAEVLERQKGWFCSNRECRFVLWKDNAYFTKIGKRLTPQIVEKLLRDGRVKLKDCKSQKTGKTYNADLLLSTEADGRPQFSMEFENRKGGGK